MRPTELIEVSRASHERLLTSVAALSDDDVRADCRLPGWTRGHLLTHLARNADSHVWLFEGARLSEFRQQYPEVGMRERDIELGSGRSAVELREDLSRAIRSLEAAWDSLAGDQWTFLQSTGRSTLDMVELVFRRLREVEIHHVDLDVDYLATSWPDLYVDGELARQLLILPKRTERSSLVEWLVGRASPPELGGWW